MLATASTRRPSTVEDVQPEDGVRDQEALDLGFGEVEGERSPERLLGDAGIRVLVERPAVELP
jgi:hypothetical protein